MTGAGKQMKKLVRKIEKNGAYDSDEDENPYASSVCYCIPPDFRLLILLLTRLRKRRKRNQK